MRTKTIKIRVSITEAGYKNPRSILQAIRVEANDDPNLIVIKIWIAHK